MDYNRAEREFRRLEELRQTGFLTEEEYRAQLAALQVTDEWGRLWMLQERTGQWFVYHEGQWVAATPPGRQAAVAMPEPPQAPPQVTGPTPLQGYAAPPPTMPTYPVAQPIQAGEARRRGPIRVQKRRGCIGITFRILLWDLVWLGAIYALYRRVGPRYLWAYAGVAILAAVSLFFWVRLMGRRQAVQGGISQ